MPGSYICVSLSLRNPFIGHFGCGAGEVLEFELCANLQNHGLPIYGYFCLHILHTPHIPYQYYDYIYRSISIQSWVRRSIYISPHVSTVHITASARVFDMSMTIYCIESNVSKNQPLRCVAMRNQY